MVVSFALCFMHFGDKDNMSYKTITIHVYEMAKMKSLFQTYYSSITKYMENINKINKYTC